MCSLVLPREVPIAMLMPPSPSLDEDNFSLQMRVFHWEVQIETEKYMVKHPEIVMTLNSFQIFWFCVWKCEKECVKVCDNLKSWIPSHRRFHRYLKLQKRTYIAKVMRILSFSQKYIFHTHKIVARRRIAIWGLRSARIKKLKKTDPHYF